MSPAKTFTMSRLAITLDTSQVLGDDVNSAIIKIAKWAQSQQWTVEDDASGYTRFYNPRASILLGFRQHLATSTAGCETYWAR